MISKPVLINTEDEVMEVLRQLQARVVDPQPPIAQLRERMDDTCKQLRVQGIRGCDWKTWFLEFGGLAFSWVWHKTKWRDFARFLLDKHHKYTAEPLLRWREMGIVMRIDSKLARLDNLLSAGAKSEGSDESAWDTLLDIVGYCVLGYYLAQVPRQEERQS